MGAKEVCGEGRWKDLQPAAAGVVVPERGDVVGGVDALVEVQHDGAVVPARGPDVLSGLPAVGYCRGDPCLVEAD